ncbi:hypothetical protein QVM48_08500 [Pseudomonas soli]|uniref:hypothetical protein n=1 Tax=Pseudomonas soli TaxID=1306993 RepID=UPI002893E4EA|nr:hypothetical protein [Pseudomonas soli]MDT3714378.1 hypothetical protein [Pseudomonas soli]MDT3731096.1 hypothetical protein [Pseudomonas soli]
MKLRERDLEIDFTDAIDAIVFDQMNRKKSGYHGIGEMHRVDFVVELEEAILFVEVKDPGNPKAQPEGLEKFYGELADGTLGDTFAAKFIDTFLYRWAEELLHKPVHYLSLVTFEDSELLPNFSDEIARKLPPMGKVMPRWKRQLVENCQVFNIDLWNDSFPQWPATRIAPSVKASSNGKGE